jgi:hypothetical protein
MQIGPKMNALIKVPGHQTQSLKERVLGDDGDDGRGRLYCH